MLSGPPLFKFPLRQHQLENWLPSPIERGLTEHFYLA
jgi:hypothetical protein